jgi:hypothetical protein
VIDCELQANITTLWKTKATWSFVSLGKANYEISIFFFGGPLCLDLWVLGTYQAN